MADVYLLCSINVALAQCYVDDLQLTPVTIYKFSEVAIVCKQEKTRGQHSSLSINIISIEYVVV